MAVSWNNEETFKFIDLYQSEPAIWDSSNALHKDKSKINDAWNRIADSLQVPVSELKKRKETLMSAFRMHLKKKQDSIRSGAGEADVYKPIWIFSDAMEAFLKGKYLCKSIISTEGQSGDVEEQEDQDIEPPNNTTSNTETNEKNMKIPVQRKRSIKPPELEKAEKEMSKAFNTLNQVIMNKDQKNRIENDCDLYGRLLANKLRKYSENERQEIMYEIDGLLLRRSRNCNSQYVPSPSQNYINKRPSSATSYSCPSPPSPYWINRPSLANSNSSHISLHRSQNLPSHTYSNPSPIQSPSPISPVPTPFPLPPTQIPISQLSSDTQDSAYLFPNTVHIRNPTTHTPENSIQIISTESYSNQVSTEPLEKS